MGRYLEPDQFQRMKSMLFCLAFVTLSFIVYEVFGKTAWLIGLAICSAPFAIFLIWRLAVYFQRRRRC
ncbi:MAG: hypothetical protein HZC36_12525 [Armatimonadetes bacterium]|nr:hypothetical protein [Armatimonadota bacterium]